ncbi:LysR family transcriptional regulator [Burkholderia sp. Bp8998]|uniref:LysR family transcriptional regulator n=1 Tax=Burkholderia sp. Bp8998 TaxID=2184557 RepID=UPI000F5A1373|nr:LysR family transcriptional regulator [Burkholderia sp. Bp8998]RQS19442.1 LysR family transcriptional regulator [Burkholderia sp. Bp8998]
MTLTQLRHVILLTELSSFSRAADAAFLTQPALSRSIRALEEELGGALFDRVGHRIEVTPFGQHVVEQARVICANADALSDSAAQMVAGSLGRLSIGVGPGPGAILVTPLLLYVTEHQPNLKLQIMRTEPEQLLKALRERSLDILIVDSRAIPADHDLAIEPISVMRAAIMCRPGHPILAGGLPVTLTELKRYQCASTIVPEATRRTLMERFGPDGHPDRLFNLQCGELGNLFELARLSDTIVIGVRHAAPDLVEIPTQPALNINAQYSWVSLTGRTLPMACKVVRPFIYDRLRDPE